MYRVSNENSLIIVDIVETMVDYVSIQPDIDPTKVKAALIVAQNIDLLRNIGPANLERCINPDSEADEKLRESVISSLCYFTYGRMLRMFQGIMTDGGYTTDGEADTRQAAKSVANEMYTIAEQLLKSVFESLEAEDPSESVPVEKPTPGIRVFGGEERRGSN